VIASLLIVIGWGFFLIMGVRDPEGGVKALWPIFGIANQLLAAIALCFATTILIKMQIQRGRTLRVALVTLIPLAALLTITLSAGAIKVWDANPKIGFLAAAEAAKSKIPALEQAVTAATAAGGEAFIAAQKALKAQRTIRFNNTVDAAVTAAFIVLVSIIFVLSVYEWWRLIRRVKAPTLSETEPVYLPAEAVANANGAAAFGAVALGLTMIKELSGQAEVDRAMVRAEACDCPEARTPRGRQNVFLSSLDERYRTPRRCC
jgi:carbon starvation protein